MKYTENYKFKMPDGNDYVSVDDINDNFDAVDKELAQQKSDLTKYVPLDGSKPMSSASLGLSNGYAQIWSSGDTVNIFSRNNPNDDSLGRYLAVYNSNVKEVKDCVVVADLFPNTHKTYNLYGEHNKPSGSYTGNGSAEERTINVGGIGRVLYLQSVHGALLVTPHGALRMTESDRAIYPDSNIFWNGAGMLRLQSNANLINASGVDYLYEVL